MLLAAGVQLVGRWLTSDNEGITTGRALVAERYATSPSIMYVKGTLVYGDIPSNLYLGLHTWSRFKKGYRRKVSGVVT